MFFDRMSSGRGGPHECTSGGARSSRYERGGTGNRRGSCPASSRARNTQGDPVADEQAARDWESHKPELSDGRGVVRGYHRQGGSWAPTSSHRGRPSSWIAVGLGTVGFLLCGLSLILVWTIPLLIAGGILM